MSASAPSVSCQLLIEFLQFDRSLSNSILQQNICFTLQHVQLMFAESGSDSNEELCLFDRLDQVPVGRSGQRLFDEPGIRKGRQENHRNIHQIIEACGDFNAAHAAGELDVHQHQIRTHFRNLFHRYLAA